MNRLDQSKIKKDLTLGEDSKFKEEIGIFDLEEISKFVVVKEESSKVTIVAAHYDENKQYEIYSEHKQLAYGFLVKHGIEEAKLNGGARIQLVKVKSKRWKKLLFSDNVTLEVRISYASVSFKDPCPKEVKEVIQRLFKQKFGDEVKCKILFLDDFKNAKLIDEGGKKYSEELLPFM